jgi:hemerythrin-like domain-containing protein
MQDPLTGACTSYEGEHHRLEEALSRLDRALRDRDLHTARLQLAIFASGLDRYVRSEEHILFPVVEHLLPAHCDSTTRMRSEHRSLRRLVESMKDSLERYDEPRRFQLLGNLRSVFMLHNTKEAWVIYPVLHGASS